MRPHEEGRPRRSDSHRGKDLGDEYLFYDSAGERVHMLNGTARAVYLLCDGTLSRKELAKRYTAMYDLDEAAGRRDVDDVLERLAKLDLIRFGD